MTGSNTKHYHDRIKTVECIAQGHFQKLFPKAVSAFHNKSITIWYRRDQTSLGSLLVFTWLLWEVYICWDTQQYQQHLKLNQRCKFVIFVYSQQTSVLQFENTIKMSRSITNIDCWTLPITDNLCSLDDVLPVRWFVAWQMYLPPSDRSVTSLMNTAELSNISVPFSIQV